jgi:membrane protein implicated in regulation of membrane protease activity
MDETQWGIVDIVGPALMLVVLIWLVMRTRSKKNSAENQRAEEGTRELYKVEEERRRDGTDKL